MYSKLTDFSSQGVIANKSSGRAMVWHRAGDKPSCGPFSVELEHAVEQTVEKFARDFGHHYAPVVLL